MLRHLGLVLGAREHNLTAHLAGTCCGLRLQNRGLSLAESHGFSPCRKDDPSSNIYISRFARVDYFNITFGLKTEGEKL